MMECFSRPRRIVSLIACLLCVAPLAARAAAWPDSPYGRVAAAALMEELRADLLSQPSATLTLEHWCGVHRLAADPRLRAELQHDTPGKLPEAMRARLQIGPDEPVRTRHVLLRCGDHVLSDAINWYVPARLTPEMNRILDSTDTPFGKVVARLAFQRTTLSSILLWSPLPDDWPAVPATAGGHGLALPERLFENRAILTRGRDHLPFAALAETYRRGVLEFDLPPGPAVSQSNR